MCKYCLRKPVFYNNDFYEWANEETIVRGDWTSLDIGVDEEGKLVLVAYGDGRAVYHPKYCPECGRRLENETD